MSGGGSSTGTSFCFGGGGGPASGGAAAGAGVEGRQSRSPVGRPVHCSPAGHDSSSLAAQLVRQWPSRQVASAAHAARVFHTVQPVGAFSHSAGAVPVHLPAPSVHSF